MVTPSYSDNVITFLTLQGVSELDTPSQIIIFKP